MLIVARCVFEKVRIIVPPSDKPQVIEVSPMQIRQNQVRLGFQADRSVAICRDDAVVKGPRTA